MLSPPILLSPRLLRVARLAQPLKVCNDVRELWVRPTRFDVVYFTRRLHLASCRALHTQRVFMQEPQAQCTPAPVAAEGVVSFVGGVPGALALVASWLSTKQLPASWLCTLLEWC